MGVKTHKTHAPANLNTGILSVSTTRSLENDESGHWIAKQAKKEGHRVSFHEVVPDDKTIIRETALRAIREHDLEALLITGGTGISMRDVTIEAIQPIFSKELTAFAVMFAQLSIDQIDSAAILSRAAAGIIGRTVVFCMPGSKKACKLACKAIIFPELGHIAAHIREK